MGDTDCVGSTLLTPSSGQRPSTQLHLSLGSALPQQPQAGTHLSFVELVRMNVEGRGHAEPVRGKQAGVLTRGPSSSGPAGSRLPTFILVQSSWKGVLSASSVELRCLLLNSSATARRCLANTMLRRVCGDSTADGRPGHPGPGWVKLAGKVAEPRLGPCRPLDNVPPTSTMRVLPEHASLALPCVLTADPAPCNAGPTSARVWGAAGPVTASIPGTRGFWSRRLPPGQKEQVHHLRAQGHQREPGASSRTVGRRMRRGRARAHADTPGRSCVLGGHRPASDRVLRVPLAHGTHVPVVLPSVVVMQQVFSSVQHHRPGTESKPRSLLEAKQEVLSLGVKVGEPWPGQMPRTQQVPRASYGGS